MDLVVYLETSGGTNPGHMVIGQEGTEPSGFYGFRFDFMNLPPEFRPQSRWRDYLFDHAVPGDIVDDTRYTQELLATDAQVFFKRAEGVDGLVALIPSVDRWPGFALYSFNPDDFTTEDAPCYNCVTWATDLVGRLVEGFLTPVRQGRVKLAVLQLEPLVRGG